MTAEIAESLAPHDIQAEQAVLGGLMLGGTVDGLASQDFYRPAHQLILEAIEALRGDGKPAEPIAVADELRRRGHLPRVGGAVYLHDCMQAAPSPAQAGHYAGIVRELAERRRYAERAEALRKAALNPAVDIGTVRALAEGAGTAQSSRERRTWRPVDLTAVLDGTYQRPEPTVGTRDDGRGLFYPGHLHVVAAEAEAGKTWLALAAVAEELACGRACVYLDFEDDEGGIVGRLLTMGVSREAIRDRLGYFRPEESIEALGNRQDLADALGDLQPTLAILDGVTEAMSLHGLELKDNTDVARFGRMLPRWLAASGPATVTLDHVVKDREARSGGYALGGVHKLNGLNGAMYLMENKDPFGIGRTGRSRVLVRKDRPGQLRRHGVTAHDGLFWYADLVIESHGEDFAEAWLPAAKEHANAAFRPTAIMARICETLAAASAGLSKNAIEGAVAGKAATIRYALELLVAEGYVAVESRGQAKLHKLAREFPDG